MIAGRTNALDEKQGIKRVIDGWRFPGTYSDYAYRDNKGESRRAASTLPNCAIS